MFKITRNAKTGNLDPLSVRIMILLSRDWTMKRIAKLYDIETADVYQVADVTNMTGKRHTKPSGGFLFYSPDEWYARTKAKTTAKAKKKSKYLIDRKLEQPKEKSESKVIREDIRKVIAARPDGITSSEISLKFKHPIKRVAKQLSALATTDEIYRMPGRRRVSEHGTCYMYAAKEKAKVNKKEEVLT